MVAQTQKASDTKFLDSIITKVVENVMARSDSRFDEVESRIKLLEKLVFNQKAAPVVKAKVAPAKAPARPAAKAAPKAAPTNIATKRRGPTSHEQELARLKAGEKTLKCTACKGDGLWGVKKDGTMGDCFDCFGNGKLTVTRANQLRASRLARQAS